MKKMAVFCLASVLVVGLSGGYAGEERGARPTSAQKRMMQRAMEHYMFTDFRLSGSVVDERGETVNDIKMEISERGKRGKSEREETIADRFKIKCDDCSSIKLCFKKAGFYPTYLSISAPPGKDRSSKKEAFVKELRVVLTKLRNPSALTKARIAIPAGSSLAKQHPDFSRHGRFISTDLDGSGMGLRVVPDKNKRAGVVYTECAVVDLSDKPDMYIVLEGDHSPWPDKDAGHKEWGQYVKTLSGNVRAYLEMAGDGGFILAPPPQEYSRASLMYLTEAPKEGYSKRIKLDDVWGNEAKPGRMFYFKTPAGLYGKMSMSYGYHFRRLPAPEVRCHFGSSDMIVLQPDGSRHLEDEKSAMRYKRLRRTLEESVSVRSPRSKAKAGAIIYEGPNDLEEWTQKPESTWSFKDGILTLDTKRSYSIGLDVKIPDKAKIEYTLAWKGTHPRARVYFCASNLLRYHDSSYELSTIRSSAIMCRYNMNSNTHLGVKDYKGFKADSEARFILFLDRKAKSQTLFIDGTKVGTWVDAEKTPLNGTGIVFYPYSSYSLSLSDVKVSVWDGTHPES